MYESCARECFRGWANADSQGPQAAENICFRDFEVDLQRGKLRKSEKRVTLQPQPFQVLAPLARCPGELVTREEIQHELWKGDTFVDFEQGLNFCIRRIRTALDEDAESPQYLQTIPRRGYRFVASILQTDTQDIVIAVLPSFRPNLSRSISPTD